MAMTATIDWHRPWLVPLLPQLSDLTQLPFAAGSDCRVDWRIALDAAASRRGLCNHRGISIRFVEQGDLPAALAYETFISTTGCVPTRPNLHDFFNASIWLTYPAAKAALNAIQASEIVRLAQPVDGVSANGTRGTLRDRATIFDENAALLLSCDPLLEQALRAHQWQDALLERRAAFGVSCEVRLFGHALMEKLANPYLAITAHVWVLKVPSEFFQLQESEKRLAVDALLGEGLRQGLLATPSTPLPALGVPGWWHGQDAAFYADASVFRPKRKT